METELRELMTPSPDFVMAAQNMLHDVKREVQNIANIFDEFQKDIKENQSSLKFKDKPKDNVYQKLNDTVCKEITYIGIHVRRGDMATKKMAEKGRIVAPASYIHAAMDYMRMRYTNIQFIFFSDDIEWCKSHFGLLDNVHFSEGNSAEVDLVALGQCNHTIMTVGSYGWWGAWLAGGTVVRYAFQNNPLSKLGLGKPNMDFYPPHWISIGADARQRKTEI